MRGKPKVHIDDSIQGSKRKPLEEVVASDWRDNILVPMPRIYVPDEDWIGKQVVLHMCEFHEGETSSLTGNCNCKLKEKAVTITGMKQTPNAQIIEQEVSPDLQNETN